MKKFALLAHFLLLSTTIFPIFDVSPWIVIDNTTKFDIICKLEALCDQSDFENEGIYLVANNLNDVTFSCIQEPDENGNNIMKFCLNFACSAQQTTTFNPIFYNDETMFNPKIQSVNFTYEDLQLTAFCNLATTSQQYFIIKYQPDFGINVTAQPITMYIKCLNNFKQTIRNIITAALNATSWLPY